MRHLVGIVLVVSFAVLVSPPRVDLLAAGQDRWRVRRVTWEDAAAVRARLEALGITSQTFDAYIERVRRETARRVREGDLDHLVFYLLQSNRFTRLPAIEPALSARSLVDSLAAGERAAFEKNPGTALGRVPQAVRGRAGDLLRALAGPATDPRLGYFRGIVQTHMPEAAGREEEILREYLRVMRFVYEKEFVAQKSDRPGEAVADLYRTRGLSTDTAVEAGFLVHEGLGIVRSLEPERRIRKVLVVGPGLDLAPRTALADDRPPESYQPWAVIDALLSLKLAREDDLQLVAVDVNPRVVDHLRRSRVQPPTLTLVSEIRESDTVTFTDEYESYFARLGSAIGDVDERVRAEAPPGHLARRVRINPAIAKTLTPASLDIVSERLEGTLYDLAIATNILPYLDDVQLAIAMSNIAAMLAPGGVFLHNEARPALSAICDEVGVRFDQSRHAVIARVKGAPVPLFDSVWVHRRKLH